MSAQTHRFHFLPAADGAPCTTAPTDAIPAAHPGVVWEQLQAVEKDRRAGGIAGSRH
ncbi:hypothetical protein [Streptomyces sp. NPDC006134]|uniref:hypothetical protein n=1 Tax=Streptomyces sp. NPDC006134 TaxID=3154467 RepID=UPI0033FD952A